MVAGDDGKHGWGRDKTFVPLRVARKLRWRKACIHEVLRQNLADLTRVRFLTFLEGGIYEQHTKKVSETFSCRVSVGGECGSNAAR
jgi:hypothetical protein